MTTSFPSDEVSTRTRAVHSFCYYGVVVASLALDLSLVAYDCGIAKSRTCGNSVGKFVGNVASVAGGSFIKIRGTGGKQLTKASQATVSGFSATAALATDAAESFTTR